MTAETMDLVLVDAQNAVQIFTGGGMAAILDGIEAKVRAIPLDASTAPGRDEIRSVAYRVTRTKVALDTEGKKLTEGWREATKKVNEERKRAIDRLEALGEEVRKQLTDFENKEKIRVAAHEAALEDITDLHAMVAGTTEATVVQLETWLVDLRNCNVGREWEEFTVRATGARGAADKYITDRMEARKKWEVEQDELARLRKEEADRIQRERDERLKDAAAEAARIEAERVAKEAADAARREHEEASRRAAELFQAEERAKLEAEQRAKDAEAARLASEKKAAAEKLAAEVRAAGELKAAQEKAKRDSEAAAAREREKIERERKTVEDARLKREADEAIRDKIRAEANADLLEAAHWFGPENGVEPRLIECLLSAIMDGKVRHVRVVF